MTGWQVWEGSAGAEVELLARLATKLQAVLLLWPAGSCLASCLARLYIMTCCQGLVLYSAQNICY